jgi:hypothetical protein
MSVACRFRKISATFFHLALVTAIGKDHRPERGIANGRNGSMWHRRMTSLENSGRAGTFFATS